MKEKVGESESEVESMFEVVICFLRRDLNPKV
jgi:hypothetical protein